MKRLLIICLTSLAMASCAKGTDPVETGTATPDRETTTPPERPSTTTTTTDPVPVPTDPEPPATAPPDTAPPAELVAGLAGEYHQVRRIDTPTQEMRVLVLYQDATYDFWIEPIGYHETGIVRADPTAIEFVADDPPDQYLGFAGRGVATWEIVPNEYAPGLLLELWFPDGRGYDADGYDNGRDVYFVASDPVIG
jgi:hypothetical protein